ncbi:MAG: zinc ABC transporter substrate-binding protein [Thiolinea sp.]
MSLFSTFPALQHLLSLCFFLSLNLYAGAVSAESTDKLNIFVSVIPQKYMVERVGGEHVEVNAMVQPGFSPATYEPTPRQISKLAKADFYIRVGVPFENSWMSRIQAVNPDMPVIDARENLTLRTLESHGHDDEHDHDHGGAEGAAEHAEHAAGTEQDPHIWNSPRLVKLMAAQIAEQLNKLRPQHSKTFAANLETFTAELEQLDQELSELFAGTTQRKFMVFHPSWGYLADAYNLTQIPIEADGKEPGARALTALVQQARQEQVKTIFVQLQFDERIARQVAEAIGGKVVSIDPLAEDYLNNIRQAARLIAGAADE